MKTAICKLKSYSPLTFSKVVTELRKPKESHEAYEERTWKQRAHVNREGYVIIPGIMIQNAIKAAAKYLSKQIPGKGKATFTKNFEAGIYIEYDYPLPIKIEDVKASEVFVPSDGVRGSGKRVWKKFPTIEEWEITIKVIIFDDIIDSETFVEAIDTAGFLIGIGSWRPRNSGRNGMFSVELLEWNDDVPLNFIKK